MQSKDTRNVYRDAHRVIHRLFIMLVFIVLPLILTAPVKVHAASTLNITYDANGGYFESDPSKTQNVMTYEWKEGIQGPYYSHTANISDEGVRAGDYARNLQTKDVVSIPGAPSLHVKLTYGTENNYDMIYVFKGEYTGAVSRNMSAGQMARYMGGNNSTKTVEFDVEGDTVTFAFFSDNSSNYYGYYAIVTSSPYESWQLVNGEYDNNLLHNTLNREKSKKWYTDPECTTEWAFNPFDKNLSDMTVYAKWTDETYWQDDYTYTLDETEHTITITKYNGDGTELVLPAKAKINGIEYDTIVNGAVFSGKKAINSIVIKQGVKAGSLLNNMFYNCSSLASLDISGFDTGNVTDMDSMFAGCSSLTSLDVSGFNTSSVTDMDYMFDGCRGLASLDLSGFDTSNVTSMGGMFYACASLTSLDLSGFDTSSVTKMEMMFYNCTSLTTLDLSGVDTSNVTDMEMMFHNCTSLTSLDLSGFDTSNVTDMSSMFYSCRSLTSLDVSGFDTSNVTNMSYMFAGCSSLTSLDASGWDTSNVTNMSGMFSGCSSLTSLGASGWDTSKVTYMGSMFYSCSSLTFLDLSGFDTSKVTYMGSMFFGCSSLTSIDLSGFDTSSVTNMGYMLNNCPSLTSIDVSGFDTSNVTDMSNMFAHCSSLTFLDLSGFDTSNVTDGMAEMFYGCTSLTSLDVSGFDTGKVRYMDNIFSKCSKLKSIQLGSEFSFQDEKLPSPSSDTPFTGKWIRNDQTYGPYTAEELRDNYNQDMAGLWLWECNENSDSVYFDANGGYTSSSPVFTESLTEEITMPDTSTTTRAHYTLTGWNTEPDGTGRSFDIGETVNDIVVFNAHTPIYAQWAASDNREYKVYHYQQKSDLDGYSLVDKESFFANKDTNVTPETKQYIGFTSPDVKTGTVLDDDSLVIEYYYDRIIYTVNFDGNGAETGKMPPQRLIGGSKTRLAENKYGKPANMFTGWNTAADGSGTQYSDREQVDGFPGIDGTSVTLYAQWLDNSAAAFDPAVQELYVTAKAGQTIVIPDLPAGITYEIEETDVPDGWTLKVSKNNKGSVIKNTIIHSSMTNRYTAQGQADIIAHKRLIGDVPEEGQFAFQLLDNKGELIDSKTNDAADTDPFITNDNGQMIENPYYGTAPISFAPVYYTLQDIGEHTYKIREVPGESEKYIYDSHEETVKVIVSDAGSGILSVDVRYDNDGAVFTNSANPGSLEISKAVTADKTADKEAGFTFIPHIYGANGSEPTDKFTAKHKYADYQLRREEIKKVSHTPNVDDDRVKTSNIESYKNYGNVVTINGAEKLHVKIHYTKQNGYLYIWPGAWEQVNDHERLWDSFNETFNDSTAIKVYEWEVQDDYPLLYDEFDIESDSVTFAYGGEADEASTAEYANYGYYAEITGIGETETGCETVEFTSGSPITLKAGEAFEIIGLPDGVTYTVTENELPDWQLISHSGDNGTITAGEKSSASFVNAYHTEGQAVITAHKTLIGGSVAETPFTFQLVDQDMQLLQTASQDDHGNVLFDPIHYTNDDIGKTYTYFIKETVDPNSTVVFDSSVKEVQVTVSDNGTGEINADIMYPDGQEFTNYNCHSITVSKQVTGDLGNKLQDFNFEIQLTGNDIDKSEIHYTKGSKTGVVTLSKDGVYTFTLHGDETISFDNIVNGTQYKITETDANKMNYVTSVDSATTGTLTSDHSVTFTNKRDVAYMPATGGNGTSMAAVFACIFATISAGLYTYEKQRNYFGIDKG